MQAGPYRVRAVETGRFRLDGGAMFGTVPKVLWEKSNPPDARNRIELALRCLLAEGEGRRILVDAGVGGATFGPKEAEMYAVEDKGPGLDPASITDVVLTHLHFDHAGGAVTQGRPTFPNATYWVQRRNLENAKHPNEREKASYLPQTWQVLEASGRLNLVDGPAEILPGIHAIPSDGHTVGMQLVRVGPVVYCADLIPLTAHVRVPFTMGYDIHPGLLIEEKRRLLEQGEKEGWILFFEHDPSVAACRIARDKVRGHFVAGTPVEMAA